MFDLLTRRPEFDNAHIKGKNERFNGESKDTFWFDIID